MDESSQCYDKYMVSSLKKKTAEDQYESCENVLKIGNSYYLEAASCKFFRNKDDIDSLESRYFLNWYAQQLIKHGNQVLSNARSIFGDKIVINAKLSGVHWCVTDTGGSHAAELAAGFFNSCKRKGYEPFLKMLKANKVGLNVAVLSYDSQPNENPHYWMKEINLLKEVFGNQMKVEATAMKEHPDFFYHDLVALSNWNAKPCVDNTSYVGTLQKALDDNQEARYKAFTYYGLDPLMEAPEKFADFVRKMH